VPFAFTECYLLIELSQIGNPGSTITRLQFSPRDNLVAWTDSDGVFSQWMKPISDDFPDPVKVSGATTSAATIPVQHKPGLELFAEDTSAEAGKGAEDDIDLDDVILEDGWIVDDMDGAHKAEVPESKRDPFVKEMGKVVSSLNAFGIDLTLLPVSITKAQPPFQPGSTPFLNKKRYLGLALFSLIYLCSLTRVG